MKTVNGIITGAAALLLMSASAQAAVLFSQAGPTLGTGGAAGTSIVNTTNDTGDWVTDGDYDIGGGTVPLYFVFTMNITNNAGETGTGGLFTSFQLFGGGNDRFAVGNSWESLDWNGFRDPNGTGTDGGYTLTGNPAYAVNTPATFVMKIDQSTSTATIWFNPNLSVLEASQPAGITTVRPNLGANDTFDSLNIRAGNAPASVTFSNMSISNSTVFVPEPSSALLAALSGLVLLRRKR